MLKRNRLLIGLIGLVAVMLLSCFPQAIAQAQSRIESFQGRGIAQGAVFSRGQNAEVALTLDGNNFGLELTQPRRNDVQNQSQRRVQYRGQISRRNNESNNPNSFTLTTRVRSFDSSENLRIITNTTGNCRIEVFDARIIYINCNTVADNSSTRFLGLEQF